MTPKRWLAVLLLVVFGAVRMPFEAHLEAGIKAAHFRQGMEIPTDSMREQLGQLGAAAALGGFRSFLATMFELQATTAYTNQKFLDVSKHYHLATQLQPREAGYWEMAGWMLGFNAASYYLSEPSLDLTDEMRVKYARDSVLEGQAFLENGLRYKPGDYGINRNLGNLLVRKRGDFCGAAEAFGRAADSAEGVTLAKRHHAYNLAYCDEKEEEAYLKLKEIADFLKGGEHPVPDERIPVSLMLHLRYFEKLLEIPESEHFPNPIDLRVHYDRLRKNFKPGYPYEKLHVFRMQRFEDVLDIVKSERIPFGKPLREEPVDAN